MLKSLKQIDQPVPQIINDDILESLGLLINDRLFALICKHCRVCITSNNALDHIKSKHTFPNYLGTRETVQDALNNICLENGISDSLPSDVQGGPDFKAFSGLTIQDAYKCCTDQCSFICSTLTSQKWHQSNQHPFKTQNWINCKAQQFIYRGTYFQVQAPLPSSNSTSFASFLDIVQPTLPISIAPPNDKHTRDLPTFIITKGIYEHLKDWYEDPKKRQSVVDIWTMPKDGYSVKLRKLCLTYIEDISSEARGRDFSVLRPFEVYPMYVFCLYHYISTDYFLAIQSRLGLHCLKIRQSRSIVCS